MADQLYKKRQGIKKQRKEAIRKIAPYRYLIVCEGSETEPKYFEGIKRIINSKYGDKIKVLKTKVDRIDIDGTGRNTESLVKYTIKKRRDALIPYGHIWCVFDRDSFSDQQFNNAISMCETHNIGAAWSNESVELWFLLHFEYLNSGITRGKYIEKLDKYFELYGVNGGKYEKNLEDIYEILVEHGDMEEAIKNAKKLKQLYRCGITPSNMKPATTVDELVVELFEYLEQPK